MTKTYRNTQYVMDESSRHYQAAVENGLMQTSITARDGKRVTLKDGREVVEFINCSYLGLDLHPAIQRAYRTLPETWGVNLCCARSRFSIEPLMQLEENLSAWLGGRVITFPSVTTTHIATLPLLASGALLNTTRNVKIIFDKLAHSSMQYLKPVLAQEAEIITIPHNDLEALEREVISANLSGAIPVYVGDGIYSMGGIAPIQKLLLLAERLNFYLYLDDAHGTSIYGKVGQGPILSQLESSFPERLILTFSMSKAFGTNGGGVVVPNATQEKILRTYGQIYSFSAPMDFAAIPAASASLELHLDGTVGQLQKLLRNNIALFDSLYGSEPLPSPIRMINIGNPEKAIEICNELVNEGYFTSVVFFPIVSRNQAQLRISISSNHTPSEIIGLVSALKLAKQKFGLSEADSVAI